MNKKIAFGQSPFRFRVLGTARRLWEKIEVQCTGSV